MQTELKVAPEGATIALYEQILSGNHTVGRRKSARKARNNFAITDARQISQGNLAGRGRSLPMKACQQVPCTTHAGPFIGREQELKQIADLLADPACWLLTLLGPGGIGKTRLAVEVGKNHQATFSHGVFFDPPQCG